MPVSRPWVALALACASGAALAAECPPLLQHELPKLRSKEVVDFCERFNGKALVVVNTASHCGFTPQFKGLEALYQRFRKDGLEVVGVPSDDFFQEADDDRKTAEVCYVNYGVTFTMTQTQPVRGRDATPLFRELAEQAGKAPRWNFYKYVVDRNGQVVASFPSKVKPDDPQLIEAVQKALAN
ncbi:glutathione peroxidase [Stutzerimonas kirkiae]|uniref:Glutathione peroxidase n=1 Tax=Stutzerimonas kirkiae TaxID=2211392 RepID=A0A4Q9RC78_9GAMM|nr:glutathione peroxidase [Stutzerimonas kirkiae]TBU97893.1 glutathione peroxidase [Stutzerimonas kirkiae]TBV04591.1 glutathione peroxidase [Stutzerimonas kirkiae]TBV11626.1 glutathione peroxidase [Stutzerimonas kirkiae]TBV16071.1 glutathione peroxidase [Stutzerimonas kirkiae]